MNRTAFSLIAMRFETPAAFRWQVLFSQAFLKFESEYHSLRMIARHNHQDAEWIEKRESGKPDRRQETDALKQLVAYAIADGSTNAHRYYGIYSRMANEILFNIQQKAGNVRDLCNAGQLGTLRIIDRIIERALLEGMESGTHYKQIYKDTKARVEQFVSLYGRSEIPGTLQIGGN